MDDQAGRTAREARELRIDAALITVLGAASLAYGFQNLAAATMFVDRTVAGTVIFGAFVGLVIGSGIAVALDMRRLGYGSWLWATAAIFTWPIGPLFYLIVRLRRHAPASQLRDS